MKTKQLLQGWQEVELGDICEILSGFAFKSDLFNKEGKGKPLIRIRDLFEGRSETYYSGKFEDKYLVKKGDFLIGMDGEFKIFEWKSEDALLNQRVCKLILNKELVFPKYIFYMISKKLREIEDKTPFVTVKHISNKQIFSIMFILPPLPVQKAIVSILEKAEALKQQREQADKLTKEYLQSVFYEMFGDERRFERIELGKVAKLINGRAYNQDELLEKGKTPVLRLGNLFSNNNWYYSDLDLEEDKYCKKGDLLYAWSASFGPRIWEGPKAIFHYHIWKIELTDKLNKIFMLHLLDHKTKEIKSIGHGITMTHVTKSGMENMVIPFPPLQLQQKFASIVEHVEKLKEKQKQSKDKIDELFNSLMQKAFNGELVR